MGRRPRELTPWESAQHLFGAELRHWRTARELSQIGLGRLTHDSGTLISKIEKGERFPSLALAQRLDQALATGGVLERLWPQLDQERTSRAAPASTPVGDTEPVAGDLGLAWSPTLQGTVSVVVELWRSEMDRRSVLVAAAWIASACAEPTREWLLNRTDDILQDRPGRTAGPSDIDALWAMSEAFTDADQRLGGGYARSTLVHYVNQIVLPLLQGSYHDTIGRELMAATARLCDLCAFMSFDSGHHGLAQRYFIQALRLAQASGNRALGAHILADMSMQAHYLGDATQALTLADAGYRTGLDCRSPSTAARCAAMQGRAHALRGDRQACAAACSIAERALERAVPADEPSWVRFFTPDQLSAEMLYMAGELSRYDDVQRLGPIVLVSTGGMERRRVLCTTTLAAAYLPTDTNPHSDVDRACELLGQVLPSLGALHSTRSLDRVNAVRRALTPHAQRPCIQAFEDRFRTTVMGIGTHP